MLVLSARDWLRLNRTLLLSQTIPTQETDKLGLMIVLQVEIHSFQEMEMLVPSLLIQMLVLNARDLPKRRAPTTVILKTGFQSATQLKTLLLKRIQVVLVLLRIQKALRKLKKVDHSQVLVLSAKVLHKRKVEITLIQETDKLGLINVMLIKILLLKKIQAELVPMKIRIRDLSQELASNAKVLLKRKVKIILIQEMVKPGLTLATQIKTLLPKRTQAALELMRKVKKDHSQVLVLNATVLLKLRAIRLIMVILKTGFQNAIQIKIPLLKRIQVVLVLSKVLSFMDLSQVLELLAKDSLKRRAPTMVILKTGLTSAIQLKTLLLRRTQVELEPTTVQKQKDPSQVLA